MSMAFVVCPGLPTSMPKQLAGPAIEAARLISVPGVMPICGDHSPGSTTRPAKPRRGVPVALMPMATDSCSTARPGTPKAFSHTGCPDPVLSNEIEPPTERLDGW